jgi:hypothetical protein
VPTKIAAHVPAFGRLLPDAETFAAHRLMSTYSGEKLISCALTILQANHSVAENQA